MDVDDEVSTYVSGTVLDPGDLIGEQEHSVEWCPRLKPVFSIGSGKCS